MSEVPAKEHVGKRVRLEYDTGHGIHEQAGEVIDVFDRPEGGAIGLRNECGDAVLVTWFSRSRCRIVEVLTS